MLTTRNKLATRMHGRLWMPSLAVLLAFLPVGINCGSERRTEVRGRWQCGGLEIAIYEDGVASFGGNRATWKPLGERLLRLEFEADGESQIAELSLTTHGDEELGGASLDLAGVPVECHEVVRDEEG